MKACPYCAEQIQDDAQKCRHCKSWLGEGDDRGPIRAPPKPSGFEMALIPVGRSGWAIAAGYMGLFAALCFPAPIAIVVAVRALRDLKEHPDKAGAGRAYFGLVMGLLGTIGLAVAFAPWLLK